MIDTATIILTSVCTGIGISIGNSLYDLLLKDYFTKLTRVKKKIVRRHKVKKPGLAAFLNFFAWGSGYLYLKKKRVLGLVLLLVEAFIVANISFTDIMVTSVFHAFNYALFAILLGGYLAQDAYKRAKALNAEKSA